MDSDTTHQLIPFLSWTMSLLCFSMDFKLNAQEEKKTQAITDAAYDAWVLVNDYFSWEKEWKNHQANDETGVIANAVFLFMRWHSVTPEEGRLMLRKEIIAREEKYCKAKEAFLASGAATEKTTQWLEMLDLVTAGNFAWSMTTARYIHGADDVYPALRNAFSDTWNSSTSDSLGCPISLNAKAMADKTEVILKERNYLDLNIQERKPKTRQMARIIDRTPDDSPKDSEVMKAQIPHAPELQQYEEVIMPATVFSWLFANNVLDDPATPKISGDDAIQGCS